MKEVSNYLERLNGAVPTTKDTEALLHMVQIATAQLEILAAGYYFGSPARHAHQTLVVLNTIASEATP